MMTYIAKIFARSNLQDIREFLLHGVECFEISELTYKERLEKATKSATENIKMKFPEPEDYEKITTSVHHYATEMQNVYMEIGLQCGAALAMQLLAEQQK